MQFAFSMLFVLLLSACGTTSSVKLSLQPPEKTSFTFLDERPSEQRHSRIDNSISGGLVIYGDDNLSPSPAGMLCAKLQEKLALKLEGKTVSLSKFYVRVFDPVAKVDVDRLNSASASVPGGYAAEPLTALLILGIEKIKNEKLVSIDIEGGIDSLPFYTSITDRYRGRVTEDNLQTSLIRSLDQLIKKLETMDMKNPPEAKISNETPESSSNEQAALEKLGDGGCNEATKFSAETYFQRGRDFVASNNYKPAMACFMRAQEEKHTSVYVDACSQIAMMYELGWGVDKNTEAAKAWLKKAEQ